MSRHARDVSWYSAPGAWARGRVMPSRVDEGTMVVGAEIPAGVRVLVIDRTFFWHDESERRCAKIGVEPIYSVCDSPQE